jgi:hypothetical protein
MVLTEIKLQRSEIRLQYIEYFSFNKLAEYIWEAHCTATFEMVYFNGYVECSDFVRFPFPCNGNLKHDDACLKYFLTIDRVILVNFTKVDLCDLHALCARVYSSTSNYLRNARTNLECILYIVHCGRGFKSHF